MGQSLALHEDFVVFGMQVWMKGSGTGNFTEERFRTNLYQSVVSLLSNF